MFHIILNALRRVVLWRVVLRRVVLRNVVYPCNTTLFWWAGLRKVREKYQIYIYQWNCRIIKEICIKYNIAFYFDHFIVSPSSIYGFWLPLWYLQIVLSTNSKYIQRWWHIQNTSHGLEHVHKSFNWFCLCFCFMFSELKRERSLLVWCLLVKLLTITI